MHQTVRPNCSWRRQGDRQLQLESVETTETPVAVTQAPLEATTEVMAGAAQEPAATTTGSIEGGTETLGETELRWK